MARYLSRRRLVSASFATLGASILLGATVAAPSSMMASAAAATQSTSPGTSCSTPAPSSRAGGGRSGIGGIQWGRQRGSGAACGGQAPTSPATPPSPAWHGSPPLAFHGGPVTGTTTPGELTVTPVYWVPAGFSLPATYQSTINTFMADAAADSGKTTNVFSALTQYTNSAGAHINYVLHAGTPITDTTAFPANGCTPDSGLIWPDGTKYSNCITNGQLLREASSFTTARSLPNTDLAHLYMYFLPEGVETCFTSANGAGGGSCSINAHGGFCAYHAFGAPPLVADMNYAVVDSPLGWTCASDGGSNTGGNQSPHANIDADSEISIASHEIAETITDPTGSAWWDMKGNEVGDDCGYVYGDSLSFQGTFGSEFNQTINGHHYFIQEEFSNQDFALVKSLACLQQEESVRVTPTTGTTGAAITVSGGGFASGEAVKVSYKTGLATPPSVTLCTTTSTGTGAFSCSASIPSGTSAGATGAHKIVAKGTTSLRKAKVTFTRT